MRSAETVRLCLAASEGMILTGRLFGCRIATTDDRERLIPMGTVGLTKRCYTREKLVHMTGARERILSVRRMYALCERAHHRPGRYSPETGNCTVANCARTDTALPVCILALQVETFCACASCNDESVCGFWFFVFCTFAPILEWTLGQVDL